MGKKRLKKSKVEAQPSVMAAAVPLSVETNEGFDRRMTVTGKITEGTIPLTSSFTITQLASANVETRGEAVFAARNAIDGVTANPSVI